MDNSAWVPTETSVLPNPTEEITRTVLLLSTAIRKFPFTSVVVPRLVPLIVTEAFGTGFPSLSSVTLPVTVFPCAKTVCAITRSRSINTPHLISICLRIIINSLGFKNSQSIFIKRNRLKFVQETLYLLKQRSTKQTTSFTNYNKFKFKTFNFILLLHHQLFITHYIIYPHLQNILPRS